MRFALIFLVLCMLVLSAGCTQLPFVGQDVIKVSNPTSQDGPGDVLVIKNIDTLPHTPVVPGQKMILSFVVENTDTLRTANNVRISLYDAPLFKDGKDRYYCNDQPCKSIECPDSCSILPGEQKLITFDLMAPSSDAIAGIITDATINFKVQYDFNTSTIYRVAVVNMDEIKLRQRAGETISIEAPQVYGSGPVRVNAELRGSPFILSEYEGSLIFTVKDTGSGTIENGKIKVNDFSITLPAGILNNEAQKEIFGECTSECINSKKELEIFKKSSIPLIFRIGSVKISEPFKTYDIRANVKYTYELRDSVKVSISPIR